ncbi:gag-polypeptide of LTR copia-type [Sesbania bispinosa]|nr:gag-polypeptide of LTR copia-type [Sesbania bispinosa]
MAEKPIPVVVQSEGVFNVGIILNESNYDVWSQLMEMHIAEREKLSYIRGKVKPPTEKDEGYEKWYAENQKVKRCLLMSMKPEIMKRYLRLPTAFDIWNALSKAFYDGSDELQVFVLNQRAFTAKQNNRTLTEYYGELVEIFRELDHRDKVVMKDPDDVKSYQKSIERLRVHIFLAGLDDDFEQVRGEILRKEVAPDLEECYALIRRETVRRTSLKTEDVISDSTAMMTRKQAKQSKGSEKGNYKCTQCNKDGHTKERCYEIIGYPEWWDHSRASKKNSKRNPTVVVVTAIDKEDDKGMMLATTAGSDDSNVQTFVPQEVDIEVRLEKRSYKVVSRDDESVQQSDENVQQSDDQQPHNEEEFEHVEIEGLPVDADDIPHQSSPQEPNIAKRILPYHVTRGIPKPTYDPNLTSKTRYPMSNYI